MAMPSEPKGPNTIAVRKRNKTAARRIIEAFNTGNTDIIDQVISPDLVDHTPGIRTSPNREGVKQQIKMFRELFPDARFNEEIIVAEGNMIVLRWQMTGTHKGRLFGRAGTGRQITFHGQETLMLDDAGNIKEHIDTFNVITFLDKLGLMDAPMLQKLQQVGVLSEAAADKSMLA